jgi:hypothetical protein
MTASQSTRSPDRAKRSGLLCLWAWALCWSPVCVVSAQEAGPAAGGAEEADPVEEAVRLYKIGLLQFEGGDYQEAARTFSAAFESDQDPILAYNAARSYEKSGDLTRAAIFYRHVLDLKSDPELRGRAREALTPLEVELERRRAQEERLRQKAVLVVRSDQVGEVLLDGSLLGSAPGSFDVPPGEHRLEVRRNGAAPYEARLGLVAGEVRDVLVVFAGREGGSSSGGWVGFGLLGGGLVTGAVALEMGDQGGSAAELLGVSSGLLVSAGLGLVVWSLWSEGPAVVADPAERGQAGLSAP